MRNIQNHKINTISNRERESPTYIYYINNTHSTLAQSDTYKTKIHSARCSHSKKAKRENGQYYLYKNSTAFYRIDKFSQKERHPCLSKTHLHTKKNEIKRNQHSNLSISLLAIKLKSLWIFAVVVVNSK